jgi:choline transporter-like protein 2/4/5
LSGAISSAVSAVEGVGTGDGLVALLVFGVAVPLALAFVWPLFLWLFAGPVIVGLIVAEVLFMILLAIYFALRAGWLDAAADALDDALNGTSISLSTSDLLESAQSSLDSVYNGTSAYTTAASGEAQTLWTILAVAQIILVAINVIVLILCARYIQKLISVLRRCTKIFKSAVAIIFFPLGRMLAQSALLVYGVLGLYFIYYAWEERGLGARATLVVIHLFLTLWFIVTVRAVAWTTMAGVVAAWYAEQSRHPAKPCCRGCPSLGLCAIGSSLWTVLSRHLGSMAFGAGVIAICNLLQLALQALEYVVEKSGASERQRLLKLVVKCLQCCVYCITKTVSFISFYGFIASFAHRTHHAHWLRCERLLLFAEFARLRRRVLTSLCWRSCFPARLLYHVLHLPGAGRVDGYNLRVRPKEREAGHQGGGRGRWEWVRRSSARHCESSA